jgi:hypothetical protein
MELTVGSCKVTLFAAGVPWFQIGKVAPTFVENQSVFTCYFGLGTPGLKTYTSVTLSEETCPRYMHFEAAISYE